MQGSERIKALRVLARSSYSHVSASFEASESSAGGMARRAMALHRAAWGAGIAGPSCPDGYSVQPSPDEPDAPVCSRDGVSVDGGSESPSTALALALDPRRRHYP